MTKNPKSNKQERIAASLREKSCCLLNFFMEKNKKYEPRSGDFHRNIWLLGKIVYKNNEISKKMHLFVKTLDIKKTECYDMTK